MLHCAAPRAYTIAGFPFVSSDSNMCLLLHAACAFPIWVSLQLDTSLFLWSISFVFLSPPFWWTSLIGLLDFAAVCSVLAGQ